MIEKTIKVSDYTAKHYNPFAEIVNLACGFKSDIYLICDNGRVNAKSLMGLVAFLSANNPQITITANGPDEAKAEEAIEKFLTCQD